MVEYIDREAANLALAEQGFDWDKAKQALASVPAADVAPVVHGEWVRLGGDEFGCTNCGFIISDWELPPQEYCYCLKCGAKMDGGADNE